MEQTVLVTGAASGIGLACVKMLLEDGCRVLAFDPQEEKMRAELPAGDEIVTMVGDEARRTGVGRSCTRSSTPTGTVDLIPTNAGRCATS